MAAAIVFLFTTASVFFLAFLALDVLHKAFEQYQLRYVTKSMNDLSDMFLFIDPKQLLVLNVCCTCLLGILGFILFNPIMGVGLAIFGFFLPMLMVKHYKKRRIKNGTKVYLACWEPGKEDKAHIFRIGYVDYIRRDGHFISFAFHLDELVDLTVPVDRDQLLLRYVDPAEVRPAGVPVL